MVQVAAEVLASCLVGFCAGVWLSRFVVADAKKTEQRVVNFAAGLMLKTKQMEDRVKSLESKIVDMVK